MGASDARYEDFQVAPWVDRLSAFISARPRLWIALGELETRLLSDAIDDTEIVQPIYLSGVARAGSTILLETLARHPDLISHRYRDFPPVFTPYWWNRFLERVPQREVPPAERSHRDGIAVTPESPEAFEEVLWMAFFPHLHEAGESEVLASDTRHPEFETFYRNHIRKLLRVRGGRRYLAKGNYNVTRLEYLLRLFPDARFVIPVRAPEGHIASLMKQHALFCEGERRHPAALRHLRRVGHFEFGLDRRPINTGDGVAVAATAAAWERGDEIEGWSRYWDGVYRYLASRLETSADLRAASLVVRYEDLCAAPQETIRRILDHCRLSAADSWLDERAAAIRFPSYYQARFTPDELETIARYTANTAARFGYPIADASDQQPGAAKANPTS